MSNDSVGKTLFVALTICAVCSVLVSGAAVALRPLQEQNRKLDIRKNLLLASGLIENSNASKEDIDKAFEQVESMVVDLSTGEVVKDISPEEFNQKKASTDPKMSKTIASSKDKAGIKRRAKYAKVYEVIKNGEVSMIVLPVHGKGLWSTMYGFVAISPDASTVKGLGFYQHGETPGLGGEIENKRWQKIWEGKKIYSENFEPQIEVVKGAVNSNTPNKEYKVDGLSGATITSNGVTGMMHYWFGDDGFGTYLAQKREKATPGDTVPGDQLEEEKETL
jgi:Na+-transporting NADH:ubiquinone oxidoreductase subunit C